MSRRRRLKKHMALGSGYYAPAIKISRGKTPLGFDKMELAVVNDSERKFVPTPMSEAKKARLARKAEYENAVLAKKERR